MVLLCTYVCVCLLMCAFVWLRLMWCSTPAPFVCSPCLHPLSVPVCLHGRFRAFVARRSDAMSALDPGLGSVLGWFTSAVELFQQTSVMWAQTARFKGKARRVGPTGSACSGQNTGDRISVCLLAWGGLSSHLAKAPLGLVLLAQQREGPPNGAN